MNKRQLEIAACSLALVTLAVSAWYWTLQVQSVLEVLEMAYG